MLSVNMELFQYDNLYNFINDSVSRLINSTPSLTASKEYWLFYFIKGDFLSSLMSLYNVDINADFMGFPTIRKNTRHAIEAFFDLYNLCNDQDYIEVLRYCSKKENNIEKYKRFMHKRYFTIYSKYEIAKEKCDKSYEELLRISQECNEYVHPNVFVDIISINDKDKKESVLRELLLTNLFIFNEAYKLLLGKFNQNLQPNLGCSRCINGNCYLCHHNLYKKFSDCVNTRLLVELDQVFISFNK